MKKIALYSLIITIFIGGIYGFLNKEYVFAGVAEDLQNVIDRWQKLQKDLHTLEEVAKAETETTAVKDEMEALQNFWFNKMADHSCKLDPPRDSDCVVTVVTVDGVEEEVGEYVGDGNPDRPGFRFDKPGYQYCGGGPCVASVRCITGNISKDYNIPDAGDPTDTLANGDNKYEEGEFLWKPVSMSDRKLVILLPSWYGKVYTPVIPEADYPFPYNKDWNYSKPIPGCEPVGEEECMTETMDSTCEVYVEGERGDYVGDSNPKGGRPTYRFDKPGVMYCGGDECVATVLCYNYRNHFVIPNAGARSEQGHFVWKPISDGDGNLAILLPDWFGKQPPFFESNQ